ncbi:MAG: serine/threonine protein phosphatase [Ruminococcaceae bacterium]|nr:serine/threonine protein phosphatase [Oscillospiraceae bacterium]
MALFAIGDTHLSLGTDKPMDIFRGWQDYTGRLEKNWRAVVSDEDTVVIAGDVSWAMKLENTLEDFSFLHSLPGRKLIMKGNHDYWWSTKAKMERFIEEQGLDSLHILFNNSYVCSGAVVCGTRGWSYDCPQGEQSVLLRECGRLRMSLDSAKDSGLEPIVFLHYPPLYGDYRCDEIMDVLHEYGVKRCLYGHLHGQSHKKAAQGIQEGIEMKLIAGDYVDFVPYLVCR